MEPLSINTINKFSKRYDSKDKNNYLTNSISNNEFENLVTNRGYIQNRKK